MRLDPAIHIPPLDVLQHPDAVLVGEVVGESPVGASVDAAYDVEGLSGRSVVAEKDGVSDVPFGDVLWEC